jgi:MSHA pilin protein MshD
MCINQRTEGRGQRTESHLSSVLCPLSSERGISMVELIMFIVIISIALVGVQLVMNKVTGHSADTLVRKQALAIAESLLEEVELMPFTFCDPSDASAATATNTAGCTLSQDVTSGPVPTTESRGGLLSVPLYSDPFDNVADYAGYTQSNITDLAGNTYTGYDASITVSRAGTSFVGAADNGEALQITVTVTAPDKSRVVLDGYRARYAPNDIP